MPGRQVILCRKHVLVGLLLTIKNLYFENLFFFVVVGYNVRNKTINEKNGKARGVLSLILLL
jgi:hypothetical protein